MNSLTKLKWVTFGAVLGVVIGFVYSRISKTNGSPPGKPTGEVSRVAQQYLKNSTSKEDSLNFSLLSEEMLKVYKSLEVSSPESYQKLMEKKLRADSTEILGVSFTAPESARVFIREFWGDTAITTTYIDFVEELQKWKYNGYDVAYQND